MVEGYNNNSSSKKTILTSQKAIILFNAAEPFAFVNPTNGTNVGEKQQ